ncbi:MAG TPA: class I SAM-dependent rRNA methyltransferase [Isosphaeraceae bacterium]|jgi:23S rRNA (cytosine1962-C5)-methyltransferase|nr:class I SAM-dependent rRNA methyltransferase [Isosphaeraceae bacterium]
MSELPRVILKPRKARPFFARHPWVFGGSVARVEGLPSEPSADAGDCPEVAVVSHEGQFVARGLLNPNGAIRVRLYRWDDAPLDDDFWRGRLEAAIRLRRELLGLDGPRTACRLVFSEADGLSGLVIDRYDRWLVAQFNGLGLYHRSDTILPMLAELTACEGIALRVDRSIADQEGFRVEPGQVFGTVPDGPIEIVEHDLIYEIELFRGQKTGFYLDQRENRRAVASYAKGRRVLDLFCHAGGFALNALKHGGAAHALGIDSSAPAIEHARRAAGVNGLAHARFEAADAFEALDRLRAAGDRFGLVVCDPPKFARQAKKVEEALKGYLRLNRAALDVLEPGGVLVTCSCSGLVDRTLFADLLGQVAEQSGRPIQFLDQRGQAPDHPVSASCLETEYLKCFVCSVE